MTEQEAVELHIGENIHRICVIEDFLRTNSDADDKIGKKNIQILTKINGVLNEIQQYRALGTVEQIEERMLLTAADETILREYKELGVVEELREAMEKQRAKKPELYGDFEDGKLLCPNCEEDLMDLIDCGFNNCPYCGKAIDWSEEE